jgi:hypothetical protein
MKKRIIVFSTLLILASCSNKKTGGEGISVNIVLHDEQGSKIEYVQLEGMADAGAQQRINEELELFATWPLFNAEETPAVTAKAKYAMIGGKYIAVRSECTIGYAEAAHPENQLQSVIFDLENAGFATQPDIYIASKAALIHALSEGKFVQVWPDTPLDDIVGIMIEEISNTAGNGYEFYLTENSLGVYLGDRPHAAGDYWAVEAPYGKIRDVLTPGFKKLLKL